MAEKTFQQFLESCEDLARPNRFEVVFNALPFFVDGKKLQLMVKKANFPQIQIQSFPLERAGIKLNIPTHAEFADLSITFFNDSKYEIKKMIHRWQKNYIYNWNDNVSVPVNSQLGFDIEVWQLNHFFERVSGVKYIYCWPKTISEIAFSHDLDNQTLDFTVDFSYTYQEILEPETDPEPGGSSLVGPPPRGGGYA